MPSVKYTYSIADDTLNSLLNSDSLDKEIVASAIAQVLDFIETSGDVCNVWFEETLTDQGDLDTIMSAHTGAAPALVHNFELFSPTNGQTVFSLSNDPLPGPDIVMFVNGVAYENGVDYILSGSTVTWQDALFTLDTSDEVQIIFKRK